MNYKEAASHFWKQLQINQNEAKEYLKKVMNVACVNQEVENFIEKERVSHDDAMKWMTKIIQVIREYDELDKPFWDMKYEARELERQPPLPKISMRFWRRKKDLFVAFN